MLLSWLLSDAWPITIPARIADIAAGTLALWLAARWCRSSFQRPGRALFVSGVNGVFGLGLYALFRWVRDTGALPWRGPLWLVELFLTLQTALFALLILVAYRRDRWRSVLVALVALVTAAVIETSIILLISVLTSRIPSAS